MVRVPDYDGWCALAVRPVDVEVGGRVYRIAATPAIGWVRPVAAERWLGVVPGLVDGELVSGEVRASGLAGALAGASVEELTAAGRDAASVASGFPWWATVRLVRAALSSPVLTGGMVLAGIDAAAVSLGAYTAAAYRSVIDGCDEKTRKKVDSEVFTAPPGTPVEELHDPVAAAAAFNARFDAQSQ